MTIATLLNQDESGTVTLFHMTMERHPKRCCLRTWTRLIGKSRAADIAAVAEALSAKIPLIAGIRASTAYKQPVCNRMVRRILDELLGGMAQ
jgi:CO/xanthine dehydrogenase FAD-binding subunit